MLLHQLAPPDHRRPRGRNDLRTDGRNLLFRNDEAVRAFRRALQQRRNPAKIRVKRADDPARQKFICAHRTERHVCALTRSRAPSPFFQRDGGRNFAPDIRATKHERLDLLHALLQAARKMERLKRGVIASSMMRRAMASGIVPSRP